MICRNCGQYNVGGMPPMRCRRCGEVRGKGGIKQPFNETRRNFEKPAQKRFV